MTARLVFEATLVELSKLQAPSLKLFEFNYFFNKAINQYINKVYNIYDVNLQTADDLRVLKSTAYLTPLISSLANQPFQNIPKNSTLITYYEESEKLYKKVITEKVENGILKTNTKLYFNSDNITLENASESNAWVFEKEEVKETVLFNPITSKASLNGATYEIKLPQDYLHLLNCVCIFQVAKAHKCWEKDSYIEVPATRLTADAWSLIVDDIYNRPSPMKPYYYIHNVNKNTSLPTGEEELTEKYDVTSLNGAVTDKSNFPRTINLGNYTASTIRKPIASRIGNTTEVRCEIRYGKDNSVFQLKEVHVDYLKVPQHIRLTQDQIDLTEDTSQIMEFPDYVNQEIINELVHLVMERVQDPRLQSHYLMTLSIAKPTLQQAQQ